MSAPAAVGIAQFDENPTAGVRRVAPFGPGR